MRSQSVCYAKTKANAQIKLDAQVKVQFSSEKHSHCYLKLFFLTSVAF